MLIYLYGDSFYMQNRHILYLIFQAVTQNRWLGIEYKNKDNKQTSFWIGIRDIDVENETLCAEGFHVVNHTIANFDKLYISSIADAHPLEESYYPVPESLKQKISENPDYFQPLFGTIPNLRILDYLLECTKLNNVPYQSEYSLLEHFDRDLFKNDKYPLTEEQFNKLISSFNFLSKRNTKFNHTSYLCVNVLSIHTKKGLFVLAYKKLSLDLKKHILVADPETVICRRFKIGNKEEESIKRFLDDDDIPLLEDFELNQEEIKNAVSKNINPTTEKVDDLPYIIPLSRDLAIDISDDFAFIREQMENDTATEPIKAFFGNLTKIPIRRKNYPLFLINKNLNLDQLLAMHNGIKYPLTYIQGPPGTGKTSTILNTIITAFFNEKTILFSSFNNHPIDSVFDSLQKIEYHGKPIPLPIFRIGNQEKLLESLDFWKHQYLTFKDTPIYTDTLERNKEEEIGSSQKLTELLKRYEEKIELEERKDAIEQLLQINSNMTYQIDLQGRQLQQVNKAIQEIGEIKNQDALSLTNQTSERQLKYLYYTSIKHIKRLGEPKNKDLLDILFIEKDEKRLEEISTYLKNGENILKLNKIFPIVASTCISANKIGTPNVYFDMTIIDEASQCENAISLLPIIRGRQLMLVGDPQQLTPVILLDSEDNKKLKQMYKVPDEYDYIKNSIYKTFLSCDSISKEILLSHHYRCAPQIITFNNKKYYNGRLKIESTSTDKEPLLFINVTDDFSDSKNIAPQEVDYIIDYAKKHPEQKIGVITPFVRQKSLIEDILKLNKIGNITCGTVHAFQGDEKDVILFSLAISDKTPDRTYDWLNSNRELVNVATSRAKQKLIVIGSEKEINRLHETSVHNTRGKIQQEKRIDDIFELKEYIKTKGKSSITSRSNSSRALGIKPYSTETEEAFLTTLSHALDLVMNNPLKYDIKKEVSISVVFDSYDIDPTLFYTGRFDFVLYERGSDKKERPLLAIELDGKEHREDAAVKRRDKMKNEICQNHHLILLRVDNTYCRRYNFIKEVLEQFFKKN